MTRKSKIFGAIAFFCIAAISMIMALLIYSSKPGVGASGDYIYTEHETYHDEEFTGIQNGIADVNASIGLLRRELVSFWACCSVIVRAMAFLFIIIFLTFFTLGITRLMTPCIDDKINTTCNE